jgi:16S rRNA (cytosine1402-N4)-methyltransferase
VENQNSSGPDDQAVHVSVMPAEVMEWLAPQPGQILVDGTLGACGHARALAAAVQPGGRVIGLDRDAAAIERARARGGELPLEPIQANYRDLREVLDSLGIDRVDGVLLDLGLSSDQLADASRGFSFQADGPLDLRFDAQSGESAAELIARLPEKELADLIYQYGEERLSRRIARRIVERRRQESIETAAQLAEIVLSATPRPAHGRHRIHPATRTFQALRIAVNDELGAVETILDVLPDCVRPEGRVAVISFHSLEDRLVKWAFRNNPAYEPLTRKPLRPSDEEVAVNPRSRSARLRVAEIKSILRSPHGEPGPGRQ